MAKTRSNKPQQPDSHPLLAAAQSLEVKGDSSLLYNSQVIDFLVNNAGGGANPLAWFYWRKVPELRYTTRYISNALSVATLYVGEEVPNGAPKRLPEGHPANDLMESFAGGRTGQSALLDRLGLHLSVAGDSVLMGPKVGSAGGEEPLDRWRVYSSEEVSSRGGVVHMHLPGNSKEVPVPKYMMPIRIWKPDPVHYWDSESPVKGSFSVLRELCGLDDHVQASINSRLSGAGIMAVPDEFDLPTADMEVEGSEADKFVALLTEVMGIAIKNRESAAALVPIILRGPAEYIDKIKHFDFSTDFSQMVPELRMTAIRRLALGMDVPPEILLGSAQSTSWSAWQTDESTLRVHIIPFLQTICSSLTDGWLHPTLEELPLSKSQKEQIPKLVVHFDISNLKIRQDISGDAQAMYDRFEIDAEALRIATGYGVDSEPDPKELAKQILLQMVRSGQPELVNYAIEGLRDNFKIELLPEVKEPEQPAPGAPGAPGENPAVGGVGVSPPPVPKVGGEQPETAEVTGPLPGDRSQEKQVSPPPTPKIGDNSNNMVK